MRLWFDCRHKHTSFPFTRKAARNAVPTTYLVCLECGREFPYDWSRMKIVTRPAPPALGPTLGKGAPYAKAVPAISRG